MKDKSYIIYVIVMLLFILGCTRQKEEVKILEPAELELQTKEVEVIIPPETLPSPSLTPEEEKIIHNKKIQEALKISGFYKGEIDGKIGPKTREAIRKFQAAKGLKVDGIVGPKTWQELEKILLSQPSPVQ
ncbi:MAG: peptidoglycan-binding protein [Candidatus Omnitrophota bacterium]